MWLLSIKPSPRQDKRFRATYCMCEIKNACKGTNHKEVDFGQKGGSTFIDHKDEEKKKNYLARHRVNENWNDPLTPGALARWLLWNLKTLRDSVDDFKKRFKL